MYEVLAFTLLRSTTPFVGVQIGEARQARVA
jgi:hypothetical protein